MIKKNVISILMIGVVCAIAVPAICSADSKTRIGVSFSFGDDDFRHNRSRHYKHYRYYPQDYYHHKKIYFVPQRRNYYYYDVYPEKAYYYEAEKTVVTDNPAYLPITSIANMASQGLPDDVIIEEIRRSNSVYHLTSEVVTYLRQNNVTDRVINEMLATARR